MREQHMQEIRERELKVARERELREREVQVRERGGLGHRTSSL
jgi:hypothetical protein